MMVMIDCLVVVAWCLWWTNGEERDGQGQSPLANIVNKDHVEGLISFDFYSKE
jgi:hypothetical protein